MLRFGLSGTNWTRKTTTIGILHSQLLPASVDSVSLSKLVSRSPHPMKAEQTVQASEWMVEQVRTVVDAPRGFDFQIFDRTPLDIMAFTRYAISRAGELDGTTICERVADLSRKFDAIFFCRPNDEWPAPVQPYRGTATIRTSNRWVDGSGGRGNARSRYPTTVGCRESTQHYPELARSTQWQKRNHLSTSRADVNASANGSTPLDARY